MQKFKTRYIVHVPGIMFTDLKKAEQTAEALGGYVEDVLKPTQPERLHALYLFDDNEKDGLDD